MQILEFLRIAHDEDILDPLIDDLEGHHALGLSAHIIHDPRLTIDFLEEGNLVRGHELSNHSHNEASHLVCAIDRFQGRHGLSATIRPEGYILGDLGYTLALDSTTLTRMLKLLETEGWVRSVPGSDRRERHWSLTSAGKRKLEQARAHWERAQIRLQTSLGEREWNTLCSNLDGITQAAQQV